MNKLRGMEYVFFPPNPEWYSSALCGGYDVEMFFPSPGDHGLEAKLLCQDCPVRGECLWTALHNKEKDGTWGGLTELERTRIMRFEPEFALSLPVEGLVARYPVIIYNGKKKSA